MSGTNWTSFGTFGSGVRNLSGPCGIAVDSEGRIYVADGLNNRIVRIDDMDGSNWQEYSAAKFRYPYELSLDSRGRIYVADSDNDRVVRMDDFTGKGLLFWGKRGTMPGELKVPVGIAFDGDGRMLLVDQRQ
jgi:tripartite motif-containing protein 71